MDLKIEYSHEAETNCPNANNCRYMTSTQGQPGYVGNGQIHIESVVTWQEHHRGLGGEVLLSVLCILGKCGTRSVTVRTG